MYRDGVTTLLLRSVNMSRSSGSSTIANGRLQRATREGYLHLVLFVGVYDGPCVVEEVMSPEARWW